MKASVFITLAIFTLLINTVSASTKGECESPAGVEQTCRTVSSSADAGFSYDFCVATLNSDRSSKTAGLAGLAAVAIKQALAHATSAESKIEDLSDLEDDEEVRGCFDKCLDAYADAIDRLRDSLDAVNSGLHARAVKMLTLAPAAADDCDAAFDELSIANSPVASEDRDYAKLASLAFSIIKTIE